MAAYPPFLEILLPIRISQDAVGSLDFFVNIPGRRDSGPEFRSLENDQPTGEWDIQYGVRAAVRDAYFLSMVAQGAFKAFRFRSPWPHERAIGDIDGLEDPPQFLSDEAGATEIQLFKRFEIVDLLGNAQTTDVIVQKLAFTLADGVTPAPIDLMLVDAMDVETALVENTHFTADRTTGKITLIGAFSSGIPAGSTLYCVRCAFHLPVRLEGGAKIKTRLYVNPNIQNVQTEPIVLKLVFLEEEEA